MKLRLIVALLAIWLMVTGFLISDGWDAFFTQRGKEPLSLDTMTYSDVIKGRAVKGECYVTYGLIGEGYTEETNKYTGKTKTTTNYYYWIIDCGDNDTMILKTRANSSESSMLEKMEDAFYDSADWEEYAEMLPGSVDLNGVFITNDSEVVGFYEEWYGYVSESPQWKDVKLAPYTLDCTQTYETRVMKFYGGAATGVVGLVVIILIAAAYFKKSRTPAVPLTAAQAAGYGNMNGGSLDVYGQQSGSPETFNSAYGSRGAASDFQTQGGSYGTTGYQSQNGSYGTTGYQSQGDSYGTTGYQSQGGSTGTTGYQSQGGSTGTTGYQSQGGSYGTTGYQSQGGSYGTTGYQSQGSSYGTTGYQSQGGSTGTTGYQSQGGSTGTTGYQSQGGSTGTTGYQSQGGSYGTTGYQSQGGSTGTTGYQSQGSSYGTPSSSYGFGAAPGGSSGSEQ